MRIEIHPIFKSIIRRIQCSVNGKQEEKMKAKTYIQLHTAPYAKDDNITSSMKQKFPQNKKKNVCRDINVHRTVTKNSFFRFAFLWLYVVLPPINLCSTKTSFISLYLFIEKLKILSLSLSRSHAHACMHLCCYAVSPFMHILPMYSVCIYTNWLTIITLIHAPLFCILISTLNSATGIFCCWSSGYR